VGYEMGFPEIANMRPPEEVFKEAEWSGLQEKDRINTKKVRRRANIL
jgi:hypothetical protein